MGLLVRDLIGGTQMITIVVVKGSKLRESNAAYEWSVKKKSSWLNVLIEVH